VKKDKLPVSISPTKPQNLYPINLLSASKQDTCYIKDSRCFCVSGRRKTGKECLCRPGCMVIANKRMLRQVF